MSGKSREICSLSWDWTVFSSHLPICISGLQFQSILYLSTIKKQLPFVVAFFMKNCSLSPMSDSDTIDVLELSSCSEKFLEGNPSHFSAKMGLFLSCDHKQNWIWQFFPLMNLIQIFDSNIPCLHLIFKLFQASLPK